MEVLNFCAAQSCDKFSCFTEHGCIHLFCSSRLWSRGCYSVFHNEFSLLKVFSPKIIEQHNFKPELTEKLFMESSLRKYPFSWEAPPLWILFSSLVYPSAFVIDSGLFWAVKWLHTDLHKLWPCTPSFLCLVRLAAPSITRRLSYWTWFQMEAIASAEQQTCWDTVEQHSTESARDRCSAHRFSLNCVDCCSVGIIWLPVIPSSWQSSLQWFSHNSST